MHFLYLLIRPYHYIEGLLGLEFDDNCILKLTPNLGFLLPLALAELVFEVIYKAIEHADIMIVISVL